MCEHLGKAVTIYDLPTILRDALPLAMTALTSVKAVVVRCSQSPTLSLGTVKRKSDFKPIRGEQQRIR